MTPLRCALACSWMLFLGCELGPAAPSGKRCASAADCPTGWECTPPAEGEPAVCAIPHIPDGWQVPEAPTGASPGTGEGGGTDTGAGGVTDGGTPSGGAPVYCREVKPLLDTYCAGCHGSPPSGGAPSSFRLDVFASVDGILGAQAKAPRIKARAADTRTMPPSSSPQPTDAERAVLAAWANAGAPECGDAPQGPADAGVGNSVGYTGGAVSFTQHVLPLLDAYCGSCHATTDPDGKLDLRPDRAYDALMSEADCDHDYRRVTPGSPANSLIITAMKNGAPGLLPAMPYNTPGLATVAPEDFKVIETWISQGAPEN